MSADGAGPGVTPAILVLAAGRSARMRGSDKLLRPVDGMPQLRRIALAAMATGGPVLVALPPDPGARLAALAGLDVTPVAVADAGQGLSASLRAGAARVQGRMQGQIQGRALMVVPADMPDLTAEDLARLCRAHRDAPDALLRAESAGRPGHPVLFPADLLPAFAHLTGDTGARDLVAAHCDRLHPVPLPAPHAELDLDTPEDWAAWEAGRPAAGQPLFAAARIVPDPLGDLVTRPGPAVMAVITGVEGTSYREPGTLMAFFADSPPSGSLTNGCIEADLALHARQVMDSGRPCHLRYGDGSPFFDIRLPCGGGIDIGLFPVADRQVLADARHVLDSRAPVAIAFAPDGTSRLRPATATGWQGDAFILTLVPATRAIIFGDGLEAETLMRLLFAAGLPTLLVSAGEDADTRAPLPGCRLLPGAAEAQRAQLLADPWTAIVTLYHDHDQETGILATALRGPAFFVGAQGSKRVAIRRQEALRLAGLAEADLARLQAPVGLIRSTRDPQSLAVSILAAIVAARLDLQTRRQT